MPSIGLAAGVRIVQAPGLPPAPAPGACRAALQSGRGHGPQFVAAAPSRTGARRFNRARAHELICTCHRAQQSRWSPAPGRCVFVITVCVCLPSHDIRTHPPTPRRPSCPRARSIMFSDRGGNGSKVSPRVANEPLLACGPLLSCAKKKYSKKAWHPRGLANLNQWVGGGGFTAGKARPAVSTMATNKRRVAYFYDGGRPIPPAFGVFGTVWHRL